MAIHIKPLDAFYDRRNTFPQKRYILNGGAHQPQLAAIPILFRKMTFVYAWAMGLFNGIHFDLSQFSGQV